MTYPEPKTLTVTIAGNEVQSYLPDGYLRIESRLGQRVDTCKFFLLDPAVEPNDWDEVIVSSGSDKYFAGYVVMVEKRRDPDTSLMTQYRVICSDYSVLFEKIRIKQQYEDKTDAYIINDIVSGEPELATFDPVTFVNEINTFDKVRFNRKTLFDVMDYLAWQANGNWYIDEDKRIHFFISEAMLAPFGLSDSPDMTNTFPYRGLVENVDGSGVVNRVEVVGGNALSNDETIFLAGTGDNQRIQFAFRYSAPTTDTSIQVYRNDGGASTNYVNNPRFEANITSSWTQSGTGGTFSRDTAEKYTGSASCKIIAGTTLCSLQSNTASLNPGESVSVSARCKADALNIGGVAIYDASNSLVRGTLYNRKTDEWEWLTSTWYNDTGAAVNVRLDLHNNALDSTGITYFDACQLEKQSWASDHINGARGTGYSWSGSADNSASSRTTQAGDIWTKLIVKVGYIDKLDGRDEVLYYYQDRALQQEVFFPGLTRAVRLTGRYEYPLRVVASNTESQSHYGKILSDQIIDTNIVSADVAIATAMAYLAKNAMAQNAYNLTTIQPGLKSGRIIKLISNLLGIDSEYLIQRATTEFSVGGFSETELELGIYSSDLIDIMLMLLRKTSPSIEWRDDEVLDNILDQIELILATEYISAVAATNTYIWGVTAQQTKWGFGVWA